MPILPLSARILYVYAFWYFWHSTSSMAQYNVSTHNSIKKASSVEELTGSQKTLPWS